MTTPRILVALFFLPACGVGGPSAPMYGCTGAKCDTPSAANATQAEAICQAREREVLRADQVAFTANAIRWSCSDVAGVNNNGKDDRGQEYCEYFAVVTPPQASASVLLGRDVVNASGQVVTPAQTALILAQADRDALDANPTREVGRCVFTSWHQDVAGPVPSCAAGASCPNVVDRPVEGAVFRMQSTINSNGAANDLLHRCLQGTPPDGYMDDFMRGCMLDYKIFQTEWRKSDPTICAAAMRLTECNCNTAATATLTGDTRAQALASALVPPQPADASKVTLRGFPLGTWADLNALPPDCEYVDAGVEANGQPSHTLVSCKITADDLLTSASDMKQLCRVKYGDNVVVHVPIPSAAVSCQAPAGATCSAQPWLVGR